jgi:hypothetical protein
MPSYKVIASRRRSNPVLVFLDRRFAGAPRDDGNFYRTSVSSL